MNDLNDQDTWYKRCTDCNEWRVTDMKHCWKCGAILGPAHSLEDLMASKRPAIVDVVRKGAIQRLWQTAKDHGYKHEEKPFIQFFEQLNRRTK